MSQFAFKRTGDADYPRHLKVLLQGPPKSGKTTFISTAPNVVVAAAEAGLMSIAHLNVPYIEVDGTDKLQTLHLILSDDSLRVAQAQKLGLPDIETVAIDTLDAWQELLKKEILKENRRTSFQRDDWGTLKERMTTILKAFVALPVNVIFTVHTTTTQDDEQKLVYAPHLQGSIKDDIAGLVDFSLLSFRQRETDVKGQPVIKYYLKNEGDLKNPTLGNRAAGRVPEICDPNFKVLHDAVFTGITRQAATPPVEVTVDVPSVVPAQSESQPAASPVTRVAPPVLPTGVPADDSAEPINASGVTMLTKEYTAQGLVVPADLKTWNLGKARNIAKFFMAWKADLAAGKGASRDELLEYLKALEAFDGEMEGVQTGVENLKKAEKPAPKTEEPVTKPDTPAEEKKPEPSEAEVEASAVALIETQLGGVLIAQDVAEDSKCAECGEQVDDLDIATLAQRRFRKPLCVKDYKAEIRK
jgi:hypothetical protein